MWVTMRSRNHTSHGWLNMDTWTYFLEFLAFRLSLSFSCFYICTCLYVYRSAVLIWQMNWNWVLCGSPKTTVSPTVGTADLKCCLFHSSTIIRPLSFLSSFIYYGLLKTVIYIELYECYSVLFCCSSQLRLVASCIIEYSVAVSWIAGHPGLCHFTFSNLH